MASAFDNSMAGGRGSEYKVFSSPSEPKKEEEYDKKNLRKSNGEFTFYEKEMG